MRRIYLALALLLYLAAPAAAQGYNDSARTISDFNRVKPLQNFQYEKSRDTLSRRVLDRKNKVIGELQDVIVNRNGRVNALQVEFDRLSLRTPVYVGYTDMKIESWSNAYIVGYTDEEVASFYPDLLAKIETAAGGESENISLRSALSAPLIDSDGRNLGFVQDVLFDSDGERAQAVYASLNIGVLRNAGVAAPFDDVSFKAMDGKMTAVISKELADAMIDFAGKK